MKSNFITMAIVIPLHFRNSGLCVLFQYIFAESQTVLVGRMVGGLVFSALLYAFTINTIKGYKAGVLFPRKNFGILIACSVALFVYMFCYDNMALVGIANDAVRQIVLDLNTVVCSMTFVVFALMYKIAIKVSEENSLTI